MTYNSILGWQSACQRSLTSANGSQQLAAASSSASFAMRARKARSASDLWRRSDELPTTRKSGRYIA
jgi:hypothetical protein